MTYGIHHYQIFSFLKIYDNLKYIITAFISTYYYLKKKKTFFKGLKFSENTLHATSTKKTSKPKENHYLS